MRPNYPRTLILSAERADCSPRENLNRTMELEDWLKTKGHAFVEGVGSYEGTTETCFIVVEPQTPEGRAEVFGMLRDFQQDSVLLVDEDRDAYLLTLDIMTADFLGKLKGVSKEEAHKKQNWTYNKYVNQYYVTTQGD